MASVYFDTRVAVEAGTSVAVTAWHPQVPLLAVATADGSVRVLNEEACVRGHFDRTVLFETVAGPLLGLELIVCVCGFAGVQGEAIEGAVLRKIGQAQSLMWLPTVKVLLIGWGNGTPSTFPFSFFVAGPGVGGGWVADASCFA